MDTVLSPDTGRSLNLGAAGKAWRNNSPAISMAMTNIARTVNMIIFILLLACCLFMDISSVA